MKLKTLSIKDDITLYNFAPGDISRIQYIVIHYFGGLPTAKEISAYFRTSRDNTSAHYCVDEQKIVYRCVQDKDIAWHCGTKNAYMHPDCRNANSIGIEARPSILDTKYKNDAGYAGWYFTKAVEDNVVELTRALMREYDIPVERVLRHYDITGKRCPRPWVGGDTNLYYKTSGDYQWSIFKERLVEEEVTQADFDKMMNVWLASRNALPGNTWEGFPEAWAKAKSKGVFDGTSPQGFITRGQVAVVLDRLGVMGK